MIHHLTRGCARDVLTEKGTCRGKHKTFRRPGRIGGIVTGIADPIAVGIRLVVGDQRAVIVQIGPAIVVIVPIADVPCEVRVMVFLRWIGIGGTVVTITTDPIGIDVV
jgi:hypothetical protein